MANRIAVSRVSAYLIDYATIVAYIGILTALSLLLLQEALRPIVSIEEKLSGHAFAFVTLTLPVWLYFTVQESGSKHATIGKRLLKLEVTGSRSGNARFPSIALRNGVKLLPWEFAHAAIWYVPERPFLDAMPTANLAICMAAILASALYVLTIFVGDGRTPYDRISGTQVESVSG